LAALADAEEAIDAAISVSASSDARSLQPACLPIASLLRPDHARTRGAAN
jgi:hypothetical protein